VADGTVKIPGDGTVKRQWVVVGGALVIGIVGYAWWHAGRAGATPAGDVAVEQPADLAPADVGSVSSGGGVTDTGATFITTNDQWTSRAVAAMVDLGYDAVLVSEALGKFLASQQLTQQEANYVQTAIALVGKPPIGEHSIRMLPASSATTPTTTTTGSTNKLNQQHQYVTQVHEFIHDTPVRDAVRRFSDALVATPNAVEWAVRLTQGDPRNTGHIRNGIILKQHRIYLHVVKIKILRTA